VDFHLEVARLEHIEQLIDIELEFLSSLDVAKQLWTSYLDTLGA
jgi:hypothetical protein